MNKLNFKCIYALLFFIHLSSNSFATPLNTVFGDVDSNDPIISELINTSTMQRLKSIDQGGPCIHFGLAPSFPRFDHSVAVWGLLKHHNAPLPEQVAGLLHDASHTAFSHVADTFFNGGEVGEHSYQDTIHLEYLKSQTAIMRIFDKSNFLLTDANPDLPCYKRLEQPLPDICADRLEYNLHTAILYERLSIDEAKEILKHVSFGENLWYFTDINSALSFARLPLDFNKTVWGVAWNMVLYDYFVVVLNKAIDIHLITLDDFQYGVDVEIMEKLRQSRNDDISAGLELCENVKSSFVTVENDLPFDKEYFPKFRGIDPLVRVDGNLVRLTEVSATFLEEYEAVKHWCTHGFKVKFNNESIAFKLAPR